MSCKQGKSPKGFTYKFRQFRNGEKKSVGLETESKRVEVNVQTNRRNAVRYHSEEKKLIFLRDTFAKTSPRLALL